MRKATRPERGHRPCIMPGTYSFVTRKDGTYKPAAAESLQSCPTLCDPTDGSPPGSPSLGFSRQGYWSGVPLPSPMNKVKSESEVTQSCRTLSDPMDSSPPGSPSLGFSRQGYWSGVPLPSPPTNLERKKQ